MGASAGGHLAALLATCPEGPGPGAELPGGRGVRCRTAALSARVQAVIDFYGPSDLAALAAASPHAGTPLKLFLGGGPNDVPDRYKAASPALHVTPDTPPMLLIHGADDRLVPFNQSTPPFRGAGRGGCSQSPDSRRRRAAWLRFPGGFAGFAPRRSLPFSIRRGMFPLGRAPVESPVWVNLAARRFRDALPGPARVTSGGSDSRHSHRDGSILEICTMVSHPGRLFPPISIGAWRKRARRRQPGGRRALRSWNMDAWKGGSCSRRPIGTTPGGSPAAVRTRRPAQEYRLRKRGRAAGDARPLRPPRDATRRRLAGVDGDPRRRLAEVRQGGVRPGSCREFVSDGIAVVAMNYTLSAPGAPSWPTNFEDVRNAVRWARASAGEFDFNPNHFAAIGESAGGHLAALLGTNPDGPITTGGDTAEGDVYGSVSARVQAVVDFYGPTDLAALEQESAVASPAVVSSWEASPARSLRAMRTHRRSTMSRRPVRRC